MARDKRIPERFAIQPGMEASIAFKVGRPKALLAVIVAIIAVIVCLCCLPPAPPAPPPVPVQADDQSSRRADDTHSDNGLAPTIELPTIRGGESPAPPPIIFRSRGLSDGPDLTRPAAAVFSVLGLIDRGATDQLPQCFVTGDAPTTEGLYPRYLGHPIELVDVVEEGEAATITWNATIQTAFSLEGATHITGDRLTLTTRLIRTEALWLLVKLHE